MGVKTENIVMMMNHAVPGGLSNEFCADSVFPKRKLSLKSLAINQKGRLELIINDEVLEYPVDWLRQNCVCKSCYNPVCLSYISSSKDLVIGELTLKSVSTVQDDVVRCVFSNNHVSDFTVSWLYNRRMTKEGRDEYVAHISLQDTVSWPRSSEMFVKKATYTEVTETSSGFEIFGDAMTRDGIFVITGAPDRHISEEFGDKTGLKRVHTFYGDDFRVRNEPTPTNHAYTTIELELHIDQPYLLSCPDIQILHCLVQSKVGGENIMCDGIKAAIILRERNPEYFRILTTTIVRSEDIIAHPNEPQYYTTNTAPIINVDDKGEPAYIRWNTATHSSFFDGTVDEYENFIRAYKEFYKILYENAITIKSKPGDLLVFDNQRIMHGRLSYPSTEERQLEGWYISWDILIAKLRVIKIKARQADSE